MSENDIIKIVKIKGVKVRHKINKHEFMKRNIIRVDYRNGEHRFINMLAKRDMTDIDYFDIVYPKKIKEKVIFEEASIFGEDE